VGLGRGFLSPPLPYLYDPKQLRENKTTNLVTSFSLSLSSLPPSITGGKVMETRLK